MNLQEFLIRLAIDQDLLTEFFASPSDCFARVNLEPLARSAMISQDPRFIWSVVQGRIISGYDKRILSKDEEKNSLVIVGTGIKSVGQFTPEALACIRTANKVFYLVIDPVAEGIIKALCPTASSLKYCYRENLPRMDCYREMIEIILMSVRTERSTCAVFYGHPGVFAYASHESIQRALAEGFDARMLPGISAEDCLFADLGIDPAKFGCQSYEATDFVLNDRSIDTRSQLILWQVGVIGDDGSGAKGYDSSQLFPLLKKRLCSLYGEYHKATIYEAAMLPGLKPFIHKIRLQDLQSQNIQPIQTLYLPPID